MITIHLDTIDSTNSYAKIHAPTFSQDEITCITAEEQTAGRGRSLKKWLSPRGLNLYITFFFRLPKETPDLPCLAHLMAFSLSQVLLKESLVPQIKWPNDLLLHKKKLSGILCETLIGKEEIEIILGIGINVNMAQELLAQIDQPATSLLVETGHLWDKNELLKKLQRQFEADLKLFVDKGFAPFHPKINELLAYKGKVICVHDGKSESVGTCEGIAPDGRLVLTLATGERRLLFAGVLEPEETEDSES